MHDVIERKPGDGFDAQLGGNVFPVGQDGVEADVEAVGNLLVRAAFDDELEYVGLARGKLFVRVGGGRAGVGG